MSHYINLELNYNTYNKIVDFLMYNAAQTIKDFEEMCDLVHIMDILEEEEMRDSGKRNREFRRWQIYEDLFRDGRKYYHDYFVKIDDIIDDYVEREVLKMDIDDQDRFHMICEIIDVFKGEDND